MLGQRLQCLIDLCIDDFVSCQARESIENIKNLENDILIVSPGRKLRVEDLVPMESDNFVPDLVVVGALDALQEFDCDPFFFALHQRSHDLGDTISVQGLGFDTIDIVLIIFGCLLLPGSLRNDGIPGVGVFDAQSLNSRRREFGGSFGLSLAANKAGAVGLAAVAWLGIGTIAVDVVVEHKFLTGLDMTLGKDAHTQLVANHPLVHIAIWIA